jgi:hypothetical protein
MEANTTECASSPKLEQLKKNWAGFIIYNYDPSRVLGLMETMMLEYDKTLLRTQVVRSLQQMTIWRKQK